MAGFASGTDDPGADRPTPGGHRNDAIGDSRRPHNPVGIRTCCRRPLQQLYPAASRRLRHRPARSLRIQRSIRCGGGCGKPSGNSGGAPADSRILRKTTWRLRLAGGATGIANRYPGLVQRQTPKKAAFQPHFFYVMIGCASRIDALFTLKRGLKNKNSCYIAGFFASIPAYFLSHPVCYEPPP